MSGSGEMKKFMENCHLKGGMDIHVIIMTILTWLSLEDKGDPRMEDVNV